jgi:hypothetical protein
MYKLALRGFASSNNLSNESPSKLGNSFLDAVVSDTFGNGSANAIIKLSCSLLSEIK